MCRKLFNSPDLLFDLIWAKLEANEIEFQKNEKDDTISISFNWQIPPLIKEDINGVFAKTDDPTDIAQKILSLLPNPELLNKLGRGSRLLAMEYSNEKVTDLLIKSYEKTIEEYSARKNSKKITTH